MALKENYKDDILDTSQNVKRKYQMENNGDGTVSFTDVTEYTQQGDSFGSGDINATNSKVNTLDANLDGFKFYPTGTGIVGLISDDSAYTDEDGNYVVWGTATANQLVEDNPNTYKSVPSEEDTRGLVGEDTAKSFGGVNRMEISQFKIFSFEGYTTPKTDIVSYTFTQSGNFKGYLPCYITVDSVIETFYLYRNGIETILGTQSGQGLFTFDIDNVEYGETITIRRTRNNQNGQSKYTYLQFIPK